ncbi:hypothetical protein B0H17DRAFT_1097052, partial [Mycena rosella]
MQFFDTDTETEFGDTALVTIIRRGSVTSGTVPNIRNVLFLGLHRLAAYVDPFNATSEPLALSSAFNVVEPISAASPSGGATGTTLTSTTSSLSLTTPSGVPTNTPSPSSPSAAESKNHYTIIIALSVICGGLGIGIAVSAILLLRRRRKLRTLDGNLIRGEPYSASASERQPKGFQSMPPFSAVHLGTSQRAKAGMRGMGVGVDGEMRCRRRTTLF